MEWTRDHDPAHYTPEYCAAKILGSCTSRRFDPSGPILMGERLMEAHIRYESRAKSRRVLVSCPPQDVGKVFVQRGHRLRNNHDEDAPILEFRYREIVTIMRFRDRDPDQHLFATCVLTRAFPARVDDAPSSA
jgi:hypothetical protein